METHGETTRRAIEAVLREHGSRLMALPGVVSVAQGLCDGSPCIRVLVVRKKRDLLKQVPSAIEGYAVHVDESGRVHALEDEQRKRK